MGKAKWPSFQSGIAVLVWNVFKAKKSRWLEDFCDLYTQYDLVLLQESVLHPFTEDVFKTSKEYQWVMAQSYQHTRKAQTIGVKTGSKVAATGTRFYKSPDVEPVTKTPKMILETTYPIAGKAQPLMVLNVHAINFVSAAKFRRQMDQVIDAIKAHSGPMIVAGDFNTWSKLRKDVLLGIIADHQLEEVTTGARPRIRHLNRTLDHVFYRGLTLISATTLKHIKSSDHHPIEVQFSLTEKGDGLTFSPHIAQ